MSARSYIGDGVYAEDEGFQIVLRTDRDGATHWIVLDDQVFDSLLRFVERVHKVKITVAARPTEPDLPPIESFP